MILMALLVVVFTQCEKTPVDGGNDNKTVQVRCTIPINDGGKSDFTNFMEDGRINWKGNESIYLAIPNGENSQLVELTGSTDDPEVTQNYLTFTGMVSENMLVENAEYDVWYMGNSKQNGDVITSITGSIAEQTGSLADLGNHHIAKTTVKAVNRDNGIELTVKGAFDNQIAIAYLDLRNVDYLGGKAILGTEYELKHVDGKFDLVVTENTNATIEIGDGAGEHSYVVLFPNNKEKVWLKAYKANEKEYEGYGGTNYDVEGYRFILDIKPNRAYFITDVDGETAKQLPWTHIGETVSGQECVDLGLPSGNLWAISNLGADSPEEAGDYYAWGETEIKDLYTPDNYNAPENGVVLISGTKYDAATCKLGPNWRIPDAWDLLEFLFCFQKWIDDGTGEILWGNYYGVGGGELIADGKSIFFPLTGGKVGNEVQMKEFVSAYWIGEASSNFSDSDSDSENIYRNPVVVAFTSAGGTVTELDGDEDVYGLSGWAGICIRPVYNSERLTKEKLEKLLSDYFGEE